MNLEWIFLAEGLGADAKGAVTAIGVNQNIVFTTLPAVTKRALFAHLTGSDPLPAGNISAAYSVKSPSGKVIAAQTIVLRASGEAPLLKDVPYVVDVPGEFVLQLAEYGEHICSIEVTLPDETVVKGSVSLYVEPPQTG